MDPLVDLLCSIGDAVINVLQKCMTGSFGETNFSMNGFMVADDKFFSDSKYSGYWQVEGEDIAYRERIDIDHGDTKFSKGWLGWSNGYHVPVATYSPEQIFAGKVSGLDINFISPNTYEGQSESSAAKLQPIIASWYVALRNLTVVALLSVLVYVGIRIVISSTASDKAKYKQMLTDWVIALCLVFFLHYIMSFVLTMTESVCTAIAGNGKTNIVVEVIGQNEGSYLTDTVAAELSAEIRNELRNMTPEEIRARLGGNVSDETIRAIRGEGSIGDAPAKTFKTNLLGLARFKTQYEDFGQKMAYLIMYLALVIYTCIFTWFYLKRVLMMAFLTLVAPLVALTYPIDKIGDGKAQAFDSWLKEYVFNALIQPFHLIIYMVFVGSAMDLASTNIIYMIAALAFIIPAEKILRKFFGFEKAGAGTLGTLAGFTAGSLLGKLGKGGGSKKISGGKDRQEGEKPPRFEKKHDVNEIEGGDATNRLGQGNEGQGNEGQGNEEQVDTALDRYIADGYSQNVNGEYFNPWTDEYDSQYDPHKDSAYAQQEKEPNIDQNINQNINQNIEEKNPQDANKQGNSSQNEKEQKNSKFLNWARAHDINRRSIARVGGRAISGAAKFGTRTAFKVGAGTLAGAVAIASGGNMATATGAYMLGSRMGKKLGDGAVKVGGSVTRGASRFGKAIAENGKYEGAFADALLGGTRLGRELDLANGNTRYATAGGIQTFKQDANNVQYLREQMTAQNGGVVPSDKAVRNKMNSFDPYLAEGLKDIKEMLKAQKAESLGISSKQSAIIAAIGKEKGITQDVLNDVKRANAAQANLKQDFINKGNSEAVATKQADYTMNVLKVQNGVANTMQKPRASGNGQRNEK